MQAADSSGSYGGYGEQGLAWSLQCFLHLIEAAQAAEDIACNDGKVLDVLGQQKSFKVSPSKLGCW